MKNLEHREMRDKIKVTEMICELESSRWRLEKIFVSEDEGSTDGDEAGFSASLTCNILI